MTKINAQGGLKTIADAEQALHDLAHKVSMALTIRTLPEYSITKLPRAVPANQLIVITDATAGRVVCVSDGTDWLELQPTGPVS